MSHPREGRITEASLLHATPLSPFPNMIRAITCQMSVMVNQIKPLFGKQGLTLTCLSLMQQRMFFTHTHTNKLINAHTYQLIHIQHMHWSVVIGPTSHKYNRNSVYLQLLSLFLSMITDLSTSFNMARPYTSSHFLSHPLPLLWLYLLFYSSLESDVLCQVVITERS